MTTINPRIGTQRVIAERAVTNQIFAVKIYAPTAVRRAVGSAVDKNFTPITQAIYGGLKGGVFPEEPLKRANLEIARRAQRAIVTGWRARLPVKSPPYRRGSDPTKSRLSGKLGEALASEDMLQGTTARGISFLNTTRLATEARHWYRVNYGAFGYRVGAVRKPKAYPVTIDGHTMFALQDEAQPAPNSWLPRRFMFRDNMFIPVKGPANKEGGGHRAALFTDLGFKSVADNVGPVYREMLFDYFRHGGMAQRFEAKGVHLSVTTSGRISR